MIPKFRAWDKHEQKMFANNELIIWNGNVYANDSKKLTCNNLKGWSIDDECLMQSTGLKDKNGKEVFVGDIVKCTRGCPHEVYLEKEYGGTFIGGMPAIYLKGIKEGYAWTEAEEIVGNIYENKRLLEVSD
mgnify:CR=1 FL=1|jgi:uncharacterized phage protein (TIGR01671 family)